jgi:AAA15 family ATPase/GTPase
MILEFSIENYKSFRERQTFSLIPDESKNEAADHFFSVNDKYALLRAAVVYGANASGKSNFIEALEAFRNLVLLPADRGPQERFAAYAPFQFSDRTLGAPSIFSLDFLLSGIRYTYTLCISAVAVLNESLYFCPQGREAKLFARTGQKYEFGEYLKGQRAVVAELTNANQLFLSKGAGNNIPQLMEVHRFFNESLLVLPFDDVREEYSYLDLIAERIRKAPKNDPFLRNFTALLKSFDTGILHFKVEESDNPATKSKYEILTQHLHFDQNDKERGVATFLLEWESKGTQKLFVLGGLLLETLMQGRIMVIDEFERSLHPLISSYLIQLFHNPEINNRGAQLVLATHDTNLLGSTGFRRDQIWIVEKDKTGASTLYSLSDVTGIIKGAPYQSWYLSGRLGGIPSIQSLDFELNYTGYETL